MDMDFMMYAVSGTLGVCGLVLVLASWMRRNKTAADWAMALGSTLALAGSVGLIAAVAGVRLLQSNDSAFLVMSVGTLGIAVFTMGFAVDRVCDFQKRNHQAYMKNMMPPE